MAEEEAVDAFSKGDGLPRADEGEEMLCCCGSDDEGAFAEGAFGWAIGNEGAMRAHFAHVVEMEFGYECCDYRIRRGERSRAEQSLTTCRCE